ALDQREGGTRFHELLLRVLHIACPVDVGHVLQRGADAAIQLAGFADQRLGLLELAAMYGANRGRASAHQLARPAQHLLAGGVLALQLSSRPALDGPQIQVAHPRWSCRTISTRLLPLPLFSEPVIRTYPTSRVLPTCVPPSACWSTPSIFTTRICST